MKARVWIYRNGTLCPRGFEAEVMPRSKKSANTRSPWNTIEGERAALDALVEAIESEDEAEVCIGTDEPGEFNTDVEEWREA